MGIKEADFWEMTIDEVNRELEGIKYRLKVQASMDYTLANLIGISVGRCVSNKVKMPQLEEAYFFLYDEQDEKALEEEKEKQETERQVQGFLTLAEEFNRKFNEKQRGEDLQQAKN